MRFSERLGYKKARDVIQLESMDDPLRNNLWNILKAYIWDKGPKHGRVNELSSGNPIQTFCIRLWANFFKEPLEAIDDYWYVILPNLRARFSKFQWFKWYDCSPNAQCHVDGKSYMRIGLLPMSS